MSDTQWTRYQVFVQEAEGKPHLDYGSVHSTDAELALLNARDVFARRPECTSMWVVPADQIFSMTFEELKQLEEVKLDGGLDSNESYCVFIKHRQNGMMTYAGDVSASSPANALQKAVDEFSDDGSALVWWVFPVRIVTKSNYQDVDIYYAPAGEKAFRLSNDFRTVTDMRKIKQTTVKSANNG